MNRIFRIGDFCFRLICPKEVLPPPNFMLFMVDKGEPEYCYRIVLSSDFPPMKGCLLADRADLKVYGMPDGERRYIGIKGREGFYACYTEVSDREAEIILDPDRMDGLHIDPVFTSLLALERRLITRDSLILHCAYIDYGGEAVLFSAPSETGKTTQALLWEKYRRTRTINGDRALLWEQDGQWKAGGWPVCGTSEVCHHQTLPIRAIVMLSQGKSNEVHLLNAAEAFKLLYTQITVNSWNRTGVLHMMNVLDSLIANVPVYHLACTISEGAVDCLDSALQSYGAYRGERA